MESRVSSRVVVLDCRPGFQTLHDTVTVYQRDAGTDLTTNSVWLFRVGGRRVSLLIDFSRHGDQAIAKLYDDQDGDRSVAYVLIDDVPVPLESRHPTVQVVSLDGWWTKGQRTSFNLDIQVDGPLRASFGAGLGEPPAFTHLENDGQPDFRIHVRDRDGDGRPDLEWRQFHPPFPESPALSEHYRTEIVSNPEDDELPIAGSLLWPFLASEAMPLRDYAKDYRVSPPPIQMDWQRGRITHVAEFVASRGNPGSFFIYSINRVVEGTTNATNFENPFAFYDLAEADDGWPDTTIRFVALLPGELDDLPNLDPINIVMYTWDQEHAHQWNYSLNVVGNQRVDQTIDFGDFAVKAIPPDELPDWVAEQDWNAATFVEVHRRYWTSEHVYEYTPELASSVLPYRYLTGLVDEPPTALFERIEPGFRGEYTFDLDGPARLYLHPVDRRLHLHAATSGVWNMGSGRELRYRSLGGSYIDHWILRDFDRHVEQLYWAAGQLVYASPEALLIGRMPEIEEPDLIPPPRNHEEWVSLGRSLEAASPAFVPGDLAGMFADLATSVRRRPGGTVSSFRLTDDGFEFIFVPSTRADAGVTQYLVRYAAGSGYAWSGAKPVSLELSPVTILGSSAQVSAGSDLVVTVRNAGDPDAAGVRVTLEAVRPGEPSQEIGSAVLDVPGRGSGEARFAWTPAAEGRWRLVVRIDGDAAVATSTLVTVAPPPGAGPGAVVRTDGLSIIPLLLALLIMAGGALLAGEIVIREQVLWLRSARSRRRGRPRDA